MKANQKFLMDNDRGDIGVGTLIIFIAMVLVAAVAATVLIYTTGALQQKATKTSKEATQQISSNIIVEQVLGNRTNPPTGDIDNLIIRLRTDVGTTSIDLRQVIVTLMDGQYRYDLRYKNNSIFPNQTFTAISVRDEDNSFIVTNDSTGKNDTPVLNAGDLAAILIDESAMTSDGTNDLIKLTTRKTFWLTLNQETGQAVNLEITTPNSFGVNKYIALYP